MLFGLMHLCMELNWLIYLGRSIQKPGTDLHKKVAGIASVANIPEIQAQLRTDQQQDFEHRLC